MIIVKQHPDAHKFYNVDWSQWLADRNLTSTDIISFSWSAEADLEITQEVADGVISRVYVRNAVSGSKKRMTCLIQVTNPDDGLDPILDKYVFMIEGKIG